jgi:hypothetical protein
MNNDQWVPVHGLTPPGFQFNMFTGQLEPIPGWVPPGADWGAFGVPPPAWQPIQPMNLFGQPFGAANPPPVAFPPPGLVMKPHGRSKIKHRRPSTNE